MLAENSTQQTLRRSTCPTTPLTDWTNATAYYADLWPGHAFRSKKACSRERVPFTTISKRLELKLSLLSRSCRLRDVLSDCSYHLQKSTGTQSMRSLAIQSTNERSKRTQVSNATILGITISGFGLMLLILVFFHRVTSTSPAVTTLTTLTTSTVAPQTPESTRDTPEPVKPVEGVSEPEAKSTSE
jgi:hypothetical protein